MLETALLMPWILFLFAGTFDMGMYGYALISTQNATRVAATFTSSQNGRANDSARACQYALSEMSSLPNLRGVTSCDAYPLIVSAEAVTGVDGGDASNVSVTYQTVQLFPIPGLMGRLTVTRTAQMRVRK